jgi:hypothetical protein
MVVQTQPVHVQHIVPQWHLKKFADAGGWIWCYKKNKPAKRSRPKGECWVRDFYEYDVNGKRTENRYERWLSTIENNAAPILEALVSRRQLGQREIAAWASYVASLFFRTQKVRSQFSARMVQKFKEQTQSPEFVIDLQYDLFKKGELVFAQDLRAQVERLRSDMETSPSFYHVSSLPAHTMSLARALAAKAWHVLEAPPGKFFVISDCPVTTVEIVGGRAKPGPGFGKEGTIVFLPIAPRHVFVASSVAARWKPVGPPIAVDSTNRLTIGFAYERVYAHVYSPGIKALVDAEINRITFGKSAFVPANQN